MKKKTQILIVSKRYISIVLIIFGAVFALWGSNRIYKAVQVVSVPLGNTLTIIDPGHGGIDAGASDNGAVEKELNLQIAKILKGYIETNGGVCYMTRVEDTNTADPNRSKGVSQKMSDLKMRKQSIDDKSADIFISIHMNRFSQSQYRGLQVFYDDNIEESKRLGEAIQNSAREVLKDGNNRKAKATGDKIYILKGNKIPSVLVECGFLSNTEEANNLKNPDYQRKIAWGIFRGIAAYFNH